MSASRADTPVEARGAVLELPDEVAATIAIGRKGGIGGMAESNSIGDSRRLSRTVTAKRSPEPLSWRDSVSIRVMTK